MGLSKMTGQLAKTVIASAAILIALDVQPVFALSSGDIVSAGSVWLETTIAVALVFVTAMAFSLQIARGYFLRVLDKFTLRLGADIWWLAYVLIRDALIFMSFVMGLMVFFPGTFLDYPMAVPFMPLSVVFFGLALVTKLYFDADDNRNAFRFVTAVVFLGTVMWITGVVFVTETPLVLPTLPQGVSSTTGFWADFYNTYSSTNNLGLAMASFYSCFAALGVIALFGFAHPLLHSRVGGKKPSKTAQSLVSPIQAPAARAVETAETPRLVQSVQQNAQRASALSSRERLDYIA